MTKQCARVSLMACRVRDPYVVRVVVQLGKTFIMLTVAGLWNMAELASLSLLLKMRRRCRRATGVLPWAGSSWDSVGYW